jgi:hypothetical protein
MTDNYPEGESIQVAIYCLEFPSTLQKELHFAFVVEGFKPALKEKS